MPFWVYVLTNRPRGVLYVGVTNDIVRRVAEHKSKLMPGFTNTYGVSLLVHLEKYSSIKHAREREYALKRWRRGWKFKLVEENNPDWRDLSGELLS
jgi:putative endonuclease